MSKQDKMTKSSTSNQLKSEIEQAFRALRTVVNSLENGGRSLAAAEEAIANDGALKKKISTLENELDGIRLELSTVQHDRESDRAHYATVTKNYFDEYDHRLKGIQEKHESQLQERERQVQDEKAKWEQELGKAKRQIQGLRDIEAGTQQAADQRQKRLEKQWLKKEEELKNELQKQSLRIDDLVKTNRSMKGNLDSQIIVRTGHETEIQLLKERLQALEGFSPPDPAGRSDSGWST